MGRHWVPKIRLVCGVLAASFAWSSAAVGQNQPAAPHRAAADLQAIDDEHDRQLLHLDQERLAKLGALAARHDPAAAAEIYEKLFRLAIAGNLFRDAEASANGVLKTGTPSPATNALAYFVKIIAEADRGAYQESLQTLQKAVKETEQTTNATPARAVLTPSEIFGISEAYYQRLVEGKQFPIAVEAFRLLLSKKPYSPEIQDFLEGRLKRLELVGKPAPAIVGTDLDGKAFDLKNEQGKVVLVAFWTSWSHPSAVQMAWVESVLKKYDAGKLAVVGINLDAAEDARPETLLPNIRRFLIEYNIPWPTLLNGTESQDYAAAYGIADVPANVLIGRDGTVVQVDLSSRNLESAIAEAVGQ